MTKWSTIALMGASLFLSIPCHSQAQTCTTDANCPTSQRCVSGLCAALSEPDAAREPSASPALADGVPPSTEPSRAPPETQTAPAPVYAPPPPRPPVAQYVAVERSEPPASTARFFEHAYFSVGGLAMFSGAGSYEISPEDDFFDDVTESGDWELELARGLHMAAYFVPSRVFHIGLFFDRLEGRVLARPDEDDNFYDSFQQMNFGVAMKVGGGVGRAFISFALDAGVASLALTEIKAQHGLWMQPRLQVDVMAVRDTPLKAAVYVAFGPTITVVGGHTDSEESLDSLFWGVAPALQLGGTFGG